MCDDRLFIIMYGFIVSYYVVSYHKMVERKVLQLGKRSPGMYVLYHTEQYNLLKKRCINHYFWQHNMVFEMFIDSPSPTH